MRVWGSSLGGKLENLKGCPNFEKAPDEIGAQGVGVGHFQNEGFPFYAAQIRCVVRLLGRTSRKRAFHMVSEYNSAWGDFGPPSDPVTIVLRISYEGLSKSLISYEGLSKSWVHFGPMYGP